MAGFGLRIARSMGMEGFTGNQFEYQIDPADTNLMFHGDPVTLNAGGFMTEASGNAAGAFDGPIMGTFAGCRYVAANGDYEFERFWDGGAGRTEVFGMLSMPAHSRFYVRGDATITYDQTFIGKRAELIYAPGSLQYGDSRVTLGGAVLVPAAGTGVVQIHRLAPLPGNDFTVAEPIFEVGIVLQQGSAADAA